MRLLQLPLPSCSGAEPELKAAPRTPKPPNRRETSVCRITWEGTCLQNTEEEEEEGKEEGKAQRVWELLPRLKPPGGPLWWWWWWWWTQSVLHRSDACLLFGALPASLPLPLPASSRLFLTLSFLSSTQTLRGTIGPRLRSHKRRGNSSLSPLLLLLLEVLLVALLVLVVLVGRRGPQKFPHSQVTTSFPLSDTNTSAPLF